MVLAAPGPLLTPPPSSSPPKAPFWSYSTQIRSQNEEKIQLPIAEQNFFHVVNKKHRWESLTAESRHFLDKRLQTDAPLQTTTVSVPANYKTAPWTPAGCETTSHIWYCHQSGPGGT